VIWLLEIKAGRKITRPNKILFTNSIDLIAPSGVSLISLFYIFSLPVRPLIFLYKIKNNNYKNRQGVSGNSLPLNTPLLLDKKRLKEGEQGPAIFS